MFEKLKAWVKSQQIKPWEWFAVGFIAVLMVAMCSSARAEVKQPNLDEMPFTKNDCGTISQVISDAERARQFGFVVDEYKNMAHQMQEKCINGHPRQGCSVHTADQKSYLDNTIDFIFEAKTHGYYLPFYQACMRTGDGV